MRKYQAEEMKTVGKEGTHGKLGKRRTGWKTGEKKGCKEDRGNWNERIFFRKTRNGGRIGGTKGGWAVRERDQVCL